MEDRRNFTPEYMSADSEFTNPEDVPEGKWDHSGFEEMYGYGARGNTAALPIRGRNMKYKRGDLAKKVRLHITNLAPTVNSADLDELFEDFVIVSANVNYDEEGNSVGTADVVADRATARQIMVNFEGAALDGEEMRFFLIDDSRTSALRDARVKDRLTYAPRSYGVTKKRPLPLPPKRPFGRIHRGKKHNLRGRMTEEELNRELEEYMKKRENKTDGTQIMEA